MKTLSPFLRGNIYMAISKTFSGLNQNALRYLLPKWMNAYSGVLLRVGVGSLLFWIYGWVHPTPGEKVTWKQRGWLLVTGMTMVFGYMWTLLMGLTYTTPISSSIFISTEPLFTFLICLVIGTECFSKTKGFGIVLSIAGAVLISVTQKSSELASNPFLGDMFCLAGAVLFSAYLVIEKHFLKTLSNATVSKWTFLGGAVSSGVMVMFKGWDATVLTQNIFSTPMLVLLFILIVPSFISYLLVDMSLKVLPATVVALYGNLILVVAAITSYIVGQDTFNIWQPIAIMLMIAGVYFVEVAEKKNAPTLSSAGSSSQQQSQVLRS